MQRKITLMIMLIICAGNAWTQTTVTSSGIEQLKRMLVKYNQTDNLSFNMQYRYSAESAPEKYLDSMRGSAAISGNLYVYQIGNTQLIKTEEYVISLFSEEKMMQLIRLDSMHNNPPMEATGVSNAMIAALDSMQHAGLVSISDSSTSEQHTVTVQYKNHPSWKSVQYVIGAKDGFLLKTTIISGMDQMLGPGLQGQGLAEGNAIIETIFSDYSLKKADTGSMQNAAYFIKKGEEFVPVASYKDYRIMLVQ